jgi:hypothetical protein
MSKKPLSMSDENREYPSLGITVIDGVEKAMSA